MDALDLIAKLKMDISDYEQGLDNAKSKADSFSSKVLGGFGKVGMAVGKATMVAVGAAATGVAAITKQAVSAYAEYQQMEGGVKKLYGNMGMSIEDYASTVGKSVAEVRDEYNNLETAQNMVLDNAKKAYETSGMSMNQYMNMATSFSASLINSLGGDTVKAAEQTDVAMRAISDNFNTFGGDIGMIQGAFQGFAKQNYTMLDNLKLGYGGTKTEMERLIEDANEYAASIGQASDLSIDSFSDIVTAIDLIQQKQNIAGTTQREAATTIQGSLGMTKAAWENLLVALADGEMDLSTYISNLVSSVSTLVGNVMPVVEQALNGVGELVTQLGPIIADELPKLISDTLPNLLEAGISMVQAIIQGIGDNIDSITDSAIEIVLMLTNAILEMLPQLLEIGLQVLLALATGIAEALPELIPTIVDVMLQIVQILIENLPLILDAGLQIIMGLIQGLLKAIPKILAALPAIMSAITSWFVQSIPMIVTTGVQVLTALVENLPAIIEGICNAIPAIITACVEAFTSPSSIAALANAGNALFTALIKLAPQITATIITLVPQIITGLINAFIAAGPQMAEAGKNLMRGLGNGLSSMVGELSTKVKGIGSTIVSAAKSALGIHSPSRVFRDIGLNTMLGYEEGIEHEALNAQRSIEKSLDFKDMEVGVNAKVSTDASSISSASDSMSRNNSNVTYSSGDTFVIPVYIGQTLFAQAVVDGQTLENYRSGGR